MALKRFLVVLPAGGDCPSTAKALDEHLPGCCRPVISKSPVYDKLTGKVVTPVEYSGVEVMANTSEEVKKLLESLKIPFESVE